MNNLNTLLLELDKAEAADRGQNAARDRFMKASAEEAYTCANRIKRAEIGAGDFTVYELLFAAGARCVCGAGMAYPDSIGIRGAWYCSAILLGSAEHGTEHSPAYPFSLYKVKSESGTATTRPKGTHIETEPTYACHNCGNTGVLPRYRTGIDERPMKDMECSQCGTRYLNDDGSSNSKMQTRWLQVVVDDESVEGDRNAK